jgi:hypothetical protein
VLAPARCCIFRFNVTTNPSAAWTDQRIVEAFLFDKTPRFPVRDNDRIDGRVFRYHLYQVGIEDVPIAPSSPWQYPYLEQLVDTIRRKCRDHVIVLNDSHVKRILKGYFAYYHASRIHRASTKNAPFPRQVDSSEQGRGIAQQMVSGLRHRYYRAA